MAVETSIVVVFGDGADSDGTVVAELDPLHDNNLDSDGELKSTFDSVAPDVPVLLIHHDDTVQLTRIVATSGSVESTETSGITQTREVDLSFATEEDTVSIGYSNTTLDSVEWNGRTGTVVISGDNIIYSSGETPFVGVATVNVTFQHQYFVNVPSGLDLDADETYEIVIFIYMENI